MAKTQYNTNSIAVPEDFEVIRERPGIYIGGVGQRAPNHLTYEIMDNAIDERLTGYCGEIHIILEKDDPCTVRDNGRGIPVKIHRKDVSVERVVMMTLHAGRKLNNSTYKMSDGLHGMGSSVMNTLSKRIRVRISRDGVVYEDNYSRDEPTIALKNGLLPIVGKQTESSTEVNFPPNPEIFEKTYFCADWLRSRLHETACLGPDITVYYKNKLPGKAEQEVFRRPEGLIAYVRALNKGQTVIHEPVYIKGRFGDIKFKCAIQFVGAFEKKLLDFYNSIYTTEGDTHSQGFKTCFMQPVDIYAHELGLLKEKDTDFAGVDIRNGMAAIVTVEHPDPILEGQTRIKPASTDVMEAVSTIAGDELTRYFDCDLGTARAIIAYTGRPAKI